MVNILNFFVQKYREDTAFAQLVDDAVTRILAAKTQVYSGFELNNVIPLKGKVINIGNSSAITFQVASQAATLVSPALADLDAVLPESPALADNIVFITDTRAVSQCTICAETSLIGVQEMQNATLRLYGPNVDGLTNELRLNSFALDSLATILDNGAGDSTLERSIYQADWLVINMLDAAPDQPQTLLLRRFLSERQDLLRNKNVVVFAFNAPFYLDSTDISKLTAYYCLYSNSSPFIDVAVRLLFREMTPNGALPVSVSGAGYDLFSALTPDPSQVITLQVEFPSPPVSTETSTPEAVPTAVFRVGDSVSVRTGVILDHNDNPVPDGTGVQFTLTQSGVSGVMQQVEAVTSQGVARASFNIDRSGLLEIRATSDPATVSFTLQMDVSGESFSVTVVAPTPEMTFTPTPESAVTPGTENTSSPAPLPNFGGWALMVVLLGGSTWLAFMAGRKFASPLWGLRLGLCAALGGLLGYSTLAVRLPGVTDFIHNTQYLGVGGIVIAGAMLGAAAGYVWLRVRR